MAYHESEGVEIDKMIYFIYSESGQVKIGFTNKNIFTRLKMLQCGCPYKLGILNIFNWESSYEGALHVLFKDEHVKGEWFEYDKKIDSFLRDPYKLELTNQNSNYSHDVSNDIQKLESILGDKQSVADSLEISIRQVYYYAKGKKAPVHIYYAIKYLLNVPEHSLTLEGKKEIIK